MLYGLLRVGLPSDKLQLARVSSEAFDQALGKARAAGIVQLDEAASGAAQSRTSTRSASTRGWRCRRPARARPMARCLKTSTSSEDEQQTFAKLYLDHRGDAKSLWEPATDAGLGAMSSPSCNSRANSPFSRRTTPTLTASLQSDLGDAEPKQLVKMGFYKKEAWLDKIDWRPSRLCRRHESQRRVCRRYGAQGAHQLLDRSDLEHDRTRGLEVIEGGNGNLSAVLLKNAIDKGFKLGQTPSRSIHQSQP